MISLDSSEIALSEAFAAAVTESDFERRNEIEDTP